LCALQELQEALEEAVSKIVTQEYDEGIPGLQTQKQAHEKQNETNLGGCAERHVIYKEN
jgi:hypothetical protein